MAPIAEWKVSDCRTGLSLITAFMLNRYLGENLRSAVFHLLGDNQYQRFSFEFVAAKGNLKLGCFCLKLDL